MPNNGKTKEKIVLLILRIFVYICIYVYLCIFVVCDPRVIIMLLFVPRFLPRRGQHPSKVLLTYYVFFSF